MRDRTQGTATRERRNRDTEINEILRSGTSNTISHSREDLELDALGHRKSMQSFFDKERDVTIHVDIVMLPKIRAAEFKTGCRTVGKACN